MHNIGKGENDELGRRDGWAQRGERGGRGWERQKPCEYKRSRGRMGGGCGRRRWRVHRGRSTTSSKEPARGGWVRWSTASSRKRNIKRRGIGAVVPGGKGGQARVGQNESAEAAVLVGKGFRRGGIFCGSHHGTCVSGAIVQV